MHRQKTIKLKHGYSRVAYRMNYAQSIKNSLGNCIMRSVMNRTLHQLPLG
jgi:hypothetical protein